MADRFWVLDVWHSWAKSKYACKRDATSLCLWGYLDAEYSYQSVQQAYRQDLAS